MVLNLDGKTPRRLVKAASRNVCEGFMIGSVKAVINQRSNLLKNLDFEKSTER